MKKILLVPALFLFALSHFSCKNRSAKDYDCKEYSLQCELEKDLILVSPIAGDSTILDVYGHGIRFSSEDKFYYYVFSPKIRILSPVLVYTMKSCGRECITYDYSPEPKHWSEYWHNDTQVIPSDLSETIPGLKQAIVLVAGPNEISLTKGNYVDVLHP